MELENFKKLYGCLIDENKQTTDTANIKLTQQLYQNRSNFPTQPSNIQSRQLPPEAFPNRDVCAHPQTVFQPKNTTSVLLPGQTPMSTISRVLTSVIQNLNNKNKLNYKQNFILIPILHKNYLIIFVKLI